MKTIPKQLEHSKSNSIVQEVNIVVDLKKAKEKSIIKIAMIGFGEVGKAFYKAIQMKQLVPAVEIRWVVVRNMDKVRRINDGDDLPVVPNGIFFTTDAAVALGDPCINIVVDCSSAESPELLEIALNCGKPVITANKALFAARGNRLVRCALENHTFILFGATVLGKIPVFLNLAHYHNHLGIKKITAICNGTTNYILSALADGSKTFDVALAEAKKMGSLNQIRRLTSRDSIRSTKSSCWLQPLGSVRYSPKMLIFKYIGMG